MGWGGVGEMAAEGKECKWRHRESMKKGENYINNGVNRL